MPTYDDTLFDPPAPLAKVTLRSLQSGKSVPDVPMLLDSGADVTLVPQAIIDQLGAEAIPDVSYEVTGFDGNTGFISVVQLELVLLNKVFRGRFLLIDQNWGIVGRDILNL
jgi:hypothetical protein